MVQKMEAYLLNLRWIPQQRAARAANAIANG